MPRPGLGFGKCCNHLCLILTENTAEVVGSVRGLRFLHTQVKDLDHENPQAEQGEWSDQFCAAVSVLVREHRECWEEDRQCVGASAVRADGQDFRNFPSRL